MNDYIRREAAKALIRMTYPRIEDRVDINCVLNSVPAADVAPVWHGHWIKHGKSFTRLQQYEVLCWSCSRCGQVERNMTPYCCNCGAKMDGGDTDETVIL
jgi:hypothetical protein